MIDAARRAAATPMQPRGPAGVDQQHIRLARGNVACTWRRCGNAAVIYLLSRSVGAGAPSWKSFASEDSPNARHVPLGGKTETRCRINSPIDGGDGFFFVQRRREGRACTR